MQFCQTHKKNEHGRSSLICMKQSIVFSLCNSEWCVRFIKKKGDITWFSTKVFSVIFEMACLHYEEKGKKFFTCLVPL